MKGMNPASMEAAENHRKVQALELNPDSAIQTLCDLGKVSNLFDLLLLISKLRF